MTDVLLSGLAGFQSADPAVSSRLELVWHELGRTLTPQGLDSYLRGVHGLLALGRGIEPVLAYMDTMPAVAREVGEQVLPDTLNAVMQLSSLTSGTVIVSFFSSLPVAARRMGDADLLRQYLGLVHQVASKAPRGLRPMLDNIDQLLDKLTLGGLRRWALWGAQTHARHPEMLQAYFSLQTPDSLSVLQRERRGILFADTHRLLNFYLRALWGRDFFMRPTSGDFESREGLRPYCEAGTIHLPDAYDDMDGVSGRDIYRAAAAHLAAHQVYTRQALSAEALTPLQMFLIGLFEDARVEYCAIQEMPGLRQLWLPLLEHRSGHSGISWLLQLARVLLDERALANADALQLAMCQAFSEAVSHDCRNSQISWDLGLQLYSQLKAQAFVLPPLHALEKAQPLYRDDNRAIWVAEEFASVPAIARPRQIRRKVSLMEMLDELDCELAGDDAQEIWTLETPFYLDQEACTINELEGREVITPPCFYPEWDFQMQLYRPQWVTLEERRQPSADAALIDAMIEAQRPLAGQVRRIIDALQPQGLVRQRRCEDGEALDLDAVVRAMVDLRMGVVPDQRFHTRYQRRFRDLAVLVLIDLSESTQAIIPGTSQSILQLAREAAVLLASAITGIGDPFAIHGFASNGRHQVHYYRYKDFDQPYDDAARARLAGMQGGWSTRMGCALRHAGHLLRQQPQRRKLVLVLTDGEPADIDERDPLYLRADCRKAVEELAQAGMTSYCLSLDPLADDYVSRIFGRNRYTVLDRLERLPERLPSLFATLTGS